MSVSKEFCGKVKRYCIDYYALLMEVGAYKEHQSEFWTYYNTHKVSKNRAAQIVLNRYYSTTALVDLALSQMFKFIKL